MISRRPNVTTKRTLGTIRSNEGARESSSWVPRDEVERRYLTRNDPTKGRNPRMTYPCPRCDHNHAWPHADDGTNHQEDDMSDTETDEALTEALAEAIEVAAPMVPIAIDPDASVATYQERVARDVLDAAEPVLAAYVAAREAAVAERIAAAIHEAKPKHMTRDYTDVDAAYDNCARIARAEGAAS